MRVPVHLQAYSYPIVVDKTCKKGLFSLNPYELSFLWKIAENKPMSLYDLQKEKFIFPESRSKSTIPVGNVEAYWAKADKSKLLKPDSYQYPFIRKIVDRLEKKQLVATSKDASGPRNRRVVSPTLKGIVYYLQNESPNEEQPLKQIKKSLEIHKAILLPFFSSKSPMGDLLDNQAFFNAFYATIWEFYGIRKVRVNIKHLEFTFDGYMEPAIKFSAKRLQYGDSASQKNTNLFDFMRRDEALDAKMAYIAYLAMNDIELLSVADMEPIFYAPILISEMELAKFENRQVGDESFLFDGDRPKEFFPKYGSLESFFTGMLFRNLLWGSIKDEETDADRTEIRDYQIEAIE